MRKEVIINPKWFISNSHFLSLTEDDRDLFINLSERKFFKAVSDILNTDDQYTIMIKDSDNSRNYVILESALSMAFEDLKNQDSSLYKEVFLPFVKHRQTPLLPSLACFAYKLSNSIMIMPEGNQKLDAYLPDSNQYFSFCVPKEMLFSLYTNSDVCSLTKLPRPGFALLELGPCIMTNYVLGYFYRYLSEWNKAPSNVNVRNLNNWMMGPH